MEVQYKIEFERIYLGGDVPVGYRCLVSLYTSTANQTLESISYCHPNDTFVKETGRLVAMRKILDQITPELFSALGGPRVKELKRAIMSAYLHRRLEGAITL